jgi:hypothetical protein
MALGDGQQWDETNPQQSTEASTIDAYDRDVRVGTRLRMQQEHVWPSSQTNSDQAGYHTYLTLQSYTGFPGFANTSQVGGLWVDTSLNLWFNNGTNHQIISSTGVPGITLGTGLAFNTANAIIVSEALGAQTTGQSAGNTYGPVTSDGFVTCTLHAGSGGEAGFAVGYTDNNDPPTTDSGARCSVNNPASGQADHTAADNSFTMFVNKGNYYKVTLSTYGGASSPSSCTISFTPLGA